MDKISIAVIVGVGFVSTVVLLQDDETAPDILASDANATALLAEVKLPDALSENAEIGKRAFDAKCASCHGTNAAGQDGIAPPLVHIIYEPGHHGDESFQRAASDGVRGIIGRLEICHRLKA